MCREIQVTPLQPIIVDPVPPAPPRTRFLVMEVFTGTTLTVMNLTTLGHSPYVAYGGGTAAMAAQLYGVPTSDVLFGLAAYNVAVSDADLMEKACKSTLIATAAVALHLLKKYLKVTR